MGSPKVFKAVLNESFPPYLTVEETYAILNGSFFPYMRERERVLLARIKELEYDDGTFEADPSQLSLF